MASTPFIFLPFWEKSLPVQAAPRTMLVYAAAESQSRSLADSSSRLVALRWILFVGKSLNQVPFRRPMICTRFLGTSSDVVGNSLTNDATPNNVVYWHPRFVKVVPHPTIWRIVGMKTCPRLCSHSGFRTINSRITTSGSAYLNITQYQHNTWFFALSPKSHGFWAHDTHCGSSMQCVIVKSS